VVAEEPGCVALNPFNASTPAPARRQRKRLNDGERLPPVHPLPHLPAGSNHIPVNAVQRTGCCFLLSDPLRYCDQPIPKDHAGKMLRCNYCADHAALCVISRGDRE